MSRNVENRPFKFGPNDRRIFIVHDCEVEIRAENDASGNVLYLGFAKVGVEEDEAKWQIAFHSWDANNSLLTKKWPQNDLGNPSTEYEFVWDDRAIYTYA